MTVKRLYRRDHLILRPLNFKIDPIARKVVPKVSIKKVNNPKFDGNHICASATNPDIKIICTNLEPTGDNYCDTSVDLKDPPGNTDEEKKFFRAMYALEGGCPGYSCQCDTSGNFIENQPKTKLTF